jgi:DNA uptake protein ComE-like DNA-binding protein
MKRSIVNAALIAAALLLSASPSLAVEKQAGTAGETKAIGHAKVIGAKATKARAGSKVKLVDINGASKQELKTLPGVGDAEADKILAGRPYNTKARLITRNVVSRQVYDAIKKLIIAKQK